MAFIQVKSSSPYWSFDIYVLEQFLKAADAELGQWRAANKGLKRPQQVQEFLTSISMQIEGDNTVKDNHLSREVEVNGRKKTFGFNLVPNKQNVLNYLFIKCKNESYPLYRATDGSFKMKPEVVAKLQSLIDFKKYVANPEGPFNDATPIEVTQTIYMAGNNTWEETYPAKQIFTDEYMCSFVHAFFDNEKTNADVRRR